MKAMIFAAGLGTRLKPFTDHHPKALAEVNDKTLLEHSIRYLKRFGIEDIIVNVHHFADQIEDVIADNSGFGSWVTISDERDFVLETGGGLKKAGWYFEGSEPFVVMNVDVLTNLDLGKMIEAHKESDSMATLAVMNRNSSRHLLFDEHKLLCGWSNSKTGEQRISREVTWMQPFAFSGVQVLSPSILQMPFQGKFSMIDVYLHFAKTNVIKAFDHTGNIFIDVGKPETLEQAGYLFSTEEK
ncbi:MAG: nucleotidyltransferase family protein [Sphingobacteriales bacterium]|nr:MAG: nucleotidyltransferase family protein [Sphingobacteriales bacterium]